MYFQMFSNMEETLEKRSSNCPGCGIEHSQHTWGFPSRFCEGNTAVELTVRNAQTAVNVETNILFALSCSDNEEEHFLKEPQEIQSRREEIGKWHRPNSVRQELLRAFNVAADSERPQVQRPQQQQHPPTATSAARITAATLRQSAPENSLLPTTPLDALLADLPRGIRVVRTS